MINSLFGAAEQSRQLGVIRRRSVAVALGVSDRWKVTCEMWHVTCDIWHVTHDMWLETHDMWLETHDRLFWFTKCARIVTKNANKMAQKCSKEQKSVKRVGIHSIGATIAHAKRVSVSLMQDFFSSCLELGNTDLKYRTVHKTGFICTK